MKTAKKISMHAGGFALVGTGVLGMFLPFIPGIIFLLLGIYMLSAVSPKIRDFFDKIKLKYPRFNMLVLKAEKAMGKKVENQIL